MIKANIEYTGMSDYWSGNGKRWEPDAGCVFASFTPETTWKDLIDQLVDDFDIGSDFDLKPVWKDIELSEIETAIKSLMHGYGYATHKEDDLCYWASQLESDEDSDDYYDLPQVIVLLEYEDDRDERDSSIDRPTMATENHIVLVDDGTLDTVIECLACETQFRFTFDGDERYYDFVTNCIKEVEAEHECDGEIDEDDTVIAN